MTEIIINAIAACTFVIDLDNPEDRGLWDRILLDDAARARAINGPGASFGHMTYAGDMTIYDLRNGRGVAVPGKPYVLFQHSVSEEEWLALVDPNTLVAATVAPPVGTVLHTRDGRRLTNGIITGHRLRGGELVYRIETDFGNRSEVNYANLCASWHISGNPMMCDIDEWRADRKRNIEEADSWASSPCACPYCGGEDVHEVNGIRVEVVETETAVTNHHMDLAEWQCRGECGGRSFWI